VLGLAFKADANGYLNTGGPDDTRPLQVTSISWDIDSRADDEFSRAHGFSKLRDSGLKAAKRSASKCDCFQVYFRGENGLIKRLVITGDDFTQDAFRVSPGLDVRIGWRGCAWNNSAPVCQRKAA
jgi:hypothetical protein